MTYKNIVLVYVADNLNPDKTMRAVISVKDSTGLIPFIAKLVRSGVDIVSTRDTCKDIRAAELSCSTFLEITGFPEILDGQVIALHPKIVGGIMADRDEESHRIDLHRLHIFPIEIVVVNFCNLSLMANLTANPSTDDIDVEGPSLLRAAARNYKHVTVVTDPADYDQVADEIGTFGNVTQRTRLRLVSKAFEALATYDRLNANLFHELEAVGQLCRVRKPITVT